MWLIALVHCTSSIWGSVCRREWIQTNGILIYKCLHSHQVLYIHGRRNNIE